MIRIDAVVVPFYGHISPMLFALKRLSEAYPNTYEIRVITGLSKKQLVLDCGFECEVIQKEDPYIFERIAFAKKKMPMIYQFLEVNRRFRELTEEIYAHLQARQADIIFVDFVTYPGVSAAIKTEIPWFTTIPTPFAIENNDGTPGLLGGLSEEQNKYHQLRNKMFHVVVRSAKKLQFQMTKKKRTPYLSYPYRSDGSETFYSNEGIIALGIEGFQFKRTWPECLEFVGYGAIHEATEIRKSEKNIENRILITMGTMAAHKTEMIFQQVKKIAPNYPNYQFIVSRGDSNDSRYIEQDNVIDIGFVAYEKILPSCKIVIHHGGAGITHMCVEHQKFAIVIPQMYDQKDFAERVDYFQLGVRINKLTHKTFKKSLDKITYLEANTQNMKRLSIELQSYQTGERIHKMIQKRLYGG